MKSKPTGDLYRSYVSSTRSGSFFRVHPYPTKINPEAILPFLTAHTSPGDVIYDPFAGTCSVGAAVARLSREQLDVFEDTGDRVAICNDLGYLPAWIGRTIFSGGDSEVFQAHAEGLLDRISEKWSWLYRSSDPEGTIRYAFWTDFVSCSVCDLEIPYYDAFVDFGGGGFVDEADCQRCGEPLDPNGRRVTEIVEDIVRGCQRRAVKRRPVWIFGSSPDQGLWNREVADDDVSSLRRAQSALEEYKKLVPVVELGEGKWGEMYRSGYHTGMTHVHHFYTSRNLLALGLLYRAAEDLPHPYNDQFKLAVSAYNVAHSTIMTRFVFKSNKTKPVVTSGQPGTLYVPHCPVEKNVFLGVRRKVKSIATFLKESEGASTLVRVQQGPAQDSGLPDESVDFIFTDPPFGGNIQYAELAQLSEAWLDGSTDEALETIISDFQGKDLATYRQLLEDAFRDCYRVLKRGKFLTVVFHSAHRSVWQALQKSLSDAGFIVLDATILDKAQDSFKQVTTTGAVAKDPVILAVKPKEGRSSIASSGEERGSSRDGGERMASNDKRRRMKYAYSQYVVERLRSGELVDLDAADLREELKS